MQLSFCNRAPMCILPKGGSNNMRRSVGLGIDSGFLMKFYLSLIHISIIMSILLTNERN